HSPEAKRGCKRWERSLSKSFQKGNQQKKHFSEEAAATALQLSSELRSWPALNRSNLHPFRLKVKELRYVLQLSGQDDAFIETLGEVKDAIGEWHDWRELAGIADKVIDHAGCVLRKQIHSTVESKFNGAMSRAESMRKKNLGAKSQKRARSAK